MKLTAATPSAAGAPRASARCPSSLPRRSTAARRAALRCRAPRARRPLPITANCSRCCGRHSTLAPTSSSTAGRCRVGIVAASAGRSTPGSMPNARVRRHHRRAGVPGAEQRRAPRRAPPRRRRRGSTRRGLRRSAAAGDSAIADDVGRVDDADARADRRRRCRAQLGARAIARRADQRHAEIEVPRRGERAVDDRAAARRRRPSRRRRSRSSTSGLDRDRSRRAMRTRRYSSSTARDLAAAVVAAVRADAVRRLRLVALRALAEADRLQRVVRAALGRPGLRVSSFWIRHCCL